jgi:hypothetical protein
MDLIKTPTTPSWHSYSCYSATRRCINCTQLSQHDCRCCCCLSTLPTLLLAPAEWHLHVKKQAKQTNTIISMLKGTHYPPQLCQLQSRTPTIKCRAHVCCSYPSAMNHSDLTLVGASAYTRLHDTRLSPLGMLPVPPPFLCYTPCCMQSSGVLLALACGKQSNHQHQTFLQHAMFPYR